MQNTHSNCPALNRKKRNWANIIFTSYVDFANSRLEINNKEEYGAYKPILSRIHSQFSSLLSHHCKVFTFRFDLHFKDAQFDESLIAKFFKQLNRTIQRQYKTKSIYVWVREQNRADAPHFHCLIAMNGNLVQSPHNLLQIINRIWEGQLNQAHPHYAADSSYTVVNTFDDTFRQMFLRVSYMAKIKDKDHQPCNKRNFSSSQLKPSF